MIKLMKLQLLWAVFSLTACANFQTNYHEVGFDLAKQAGFTNAVINTQFFDLTAFTLVSDHQQPIHVYIEGDGFAWATKSQLSGDPTPHQPIGLNLAIQDNHPNVIYLARPCQYQQTNRTCSSDYWSNRRFSAEVVDSMNVAISQLNSSHQPIEMIGYSGGAAITVLAATQRNDVVSIRTVAGNLDHQFINRLHHVSEIPESLNAIDVADKVHDLPQIHFVGTEDSVIPQDVANRFISKQPNANCASIVKVKAGHQSGWQEQWQRLMQIPFACSNKQ